jgi:FAD/FMN-containing dehydrogenase
VVYGTGDLFAPDRRRTRNIEEQWRSKDFQKSPLGPGQGDWVKLVQGAQGGIGIATWCSARCEVLPRRERLLVAGADRIEPLVEASYRALHRRLTDIHFLVDRRALASLVARTPEDLERALRRPAHGIRLSVSGSSTYPRAKPIWRGRRRRCGRERDSRLRRSFRNELLGALLHPTARFIEGSRAAAPPVYFLSTMDRAGRFDEVFDELAERSGIERGRVSRYLQPLIGGRACHLEYVVAADPSEPADLEKVDGFCAQAARPLIEAGAFFSRPHGAWSEPAMEHARSSLWVFRKIKDIFDPDHISGTRSARAGGRAA